ncbi:hypothetical protein ABFS83_07G081900 [Erythranthe nasuta]
MEGSQKLFTATLENIFEVMRRKESATDYDDLLLKIFDEKHRRAEDFIFMTRLSYGSTIHTDYDELLLSQVIGYAKKETIQLSVIPIVGGCGSGKTSLAQRVYEHHRVKDDFKVRAWVKVDDGRQELRLHQAAHGIIKSALDISCSIHELDVLDGIVRETLQSERCLIVFDGVESMSNESWSHMVKHWFDSVDLGSVVLITTSCKQVANLVGQNPFELGKLSEDDAMSLYREFMHHLEKDAPTPLLTKNVAALCGGNPLSITLLGSLTRYYGELLSAVDFSESMSLPAPDASAIILLCVWALPPYLRHCIAYCSLFPKGYALNKQKIDRMCAALRYDYAYPNGVDGLISRSFFTDMSYDDIDEVVEFRMPVLVKDIVEDVARVVYELNIVGAFGSICDDAGALSLEGEHIKPKDMQTLVLSPTIYLGGSLNPSLAEFTELRSLDLSCSGIHTLSEDIHVLKELRYLNLSYTLIERLPDSVTHLSKLETLDLSWCYHLKALPEGICKLTKMINLDLYHCESLSELPYRIGSLEKLTSMPVFVLGDKDRDCARLRDLWSLRRFKGRLEIRNLENVREIDEATRYGVLRNKYLNHLGLSWSNTSRKEADHNNNCSEILELLEPNKTRLESLDIKGYMGFTFPRWISSMKHLTKIFISDCACEQLPSLGKLKSLRELQLKGMNNIKRIGPRFYGHSHRGIFIALRELGLYDMPMLSEWASPLYFDSYVLRTLETLTVEGCPKLASLPSIRQPPNLTVCNSSSQILSSLPVMTIPKSPSSSLLIKDMNLGMSLGEFIGGSKSVKTLILFNINGEFDHPPRFSEEGALIENLGILHCRQLRDISLPCIHNLRKVHISDCPNLMFIRITASV